MCNLKFVGLESKMTNSVSQTLDLIDLENNYTIRNFAFVWLL